DATSGDGTTALPTDGAVGADDAAEDAPGERPDVDPCAGVRCAAPPPCDQPCMGCCCNPSCPPDAGRDAAPPVNDAAAGDGGAACTSPSDCKIVPFECTGCECVALASGAADPVCSGPGVQCLIDPCDGKSAACVGGHCTVMP